MAVNVLKLMLVSRLDSLGCGQETVKNTVCLTQTHKLNGQNYFPTKFLTQIAKSNSLSIIKFNIYPEAISDSS